MEKMYLRIIVDEGFLGRDHLARQWPKYAEDFSGTKEEAVERGKDILRRQGVQDVEEYLKTRPMVIRVEETTPFF